jgi:nicotinamide-nucleotide amidase
MRDAEMEAIAIQVLEACKAQDLAIGTAESCTGGLIAGALTDIAGSSAVVDCGYIVYSNNAKERLLGVPHDLLVQHGAVSGPVAGAMALGVLTHSPVDLAIAVTGIAGPGGGTVDKPVGLVHFGLARRGRDIHTEHQIFPGDRIAIRRLTVLKALELLRRATL